MSGAVVVLRRGENNPAACYLARLAPGSRRAQAQALRLVCDTLSPGARPADFAWEQLRPEQVSLVRAKCARDYAPATTNRVLSALRGVIQEAWRLGLIDANLRERLCDVEPVRGERRPAGRALSTDEIAALLRGAERGRNALRDKALLLMMIYGGLRREEAATLRLMDVKQEGELLRLDVRGKGDKDRTVYLAGPAAAALGRHLIARGRTWCDANLARVNDKVFNLHGGAAVWKVIDRLAFTAGILHVSPHDLRRTYASTALARGVDLATVQASMGHADPRTTARYDRRGDDALQRAARIVADGL
jgi:site-specific recombinase XerD